MKITSLLLGALSTMSIMANPLGLREYTQKIEMTFATEDAAKQAMLKIEPLPYGKELALSARWDDTNPAHLKTQALMEQNGIKGTFFESAPSNLLAKDPKHYEKQMHGGCTLGVHTVTHPFLPMRDPNEIFWQYMRCRIDVETKTQSQATTTVLPFCSYDNPCDADTQLDVGAAIQAAGLIGSPDIFCPYGPDEMGIPKDCLAMGFLLCPGDVEPDAAKMETQLKKYYADPKLLAEHPQFSLAMHSNHTETGLVKLNKIMESLAHNPKWWYCNQNEYAAYRYEFHHAKITKTQDGKKVVFTIQRVCPYELGANVPLYMSLTGTNEQPIAGINKDGAFLVLPHNESEQMPTVFGLAGDDGTSKNIPGVKALFTHDTENKWELHLLNSGNASLENVNVTFRFPHKCAKYTIRDHKDSVKNEAHFTAEQDAIKTDARYNFGAAYYAVQIDFTQDGVQKRLYADIREKATPIVRGNCVRDCARVWKYTNDMDFAKLSSVDAPIQADELKLESKLNMPDSMRLDPASAKKIPYRDFVIYAVDISPKNTTNLDAEIKMYLGREVWLNGQQLPISFKQTSATFKLLPGRNRLVMKLQRPHETMVVIRDATTKQPIVDFHKIQDRADVQNIKHGVLLLSFDDQNFAGWEAVQPIFQKYNAHATFFICRDLNRNVIPILKRLAKNGHSIGLHGMTHGNADLMFEKMSPDEYFDSEILPQLNACYKAQIPITSFAYPNCRRTDATDALFFSRGFRAVRGSLKLTPHDPQHLRANEWQPLVDIPRTLFPVADLPNTKLINCLLLGDAYNTHIDDILNCIKRAAEKNEVLVLTSHDIAPEPTAIGMKTEWLEAILKECSEQGVAILGFDEI